MVDAIRPPEAFIVHGHAPLNAEPPLSKLRSAFVTPQELLYIRSHGDIPVVDPRTHRVAVSGLVSRPFDFTVGELKGRFASRSVKAVMQCAGNRRADMRSVRSVSGDPWAGGAIGHAEWSGVSLAEVLNSSGCRDGDDLHVAFEALDLAETDDGAAPYGVSIPLAKALSRDVLLAYAVNGGDLTPEHGFPLRVVVPGYAGVRSPKWLSRITVQNRPSQAFQQARDYKLFPPDMRPDTQDLSRGVTIDEMPVNSAICEPEPGARLKAGRLALRGYAVASRQTDRPSGHLGRRRPPLGAGRDRAAGSLALVLVLLERGAGPSARRARTRGQGLGRGRADPAGPARRYMELQGLSQRLLAPDPRRRRLSGAFVPDIGHGVAS